MAMISSLYTKYPHLAKILYHHPGSVPILGAQEETLAKLTRAAAVNQATKATVRDARILEGYDPGTKAEETFRPPLKIADNLAAWDLEQRRYPDIRVHDRQRETAEDALNKETADRLYNEKHPEPGEVLTETFPTAEELRVPEIAGEAEILSALAKTAHSAAQWPHPTEEQLEEEPELAQWLSRDQSEITAEMPDWGKIVVDRDATQTWELLKERIAEEAAGWFAAGSPLDEEFFRQNPEAALYLKEHPTLRQDLDRHHDRAGKFAAGFARIHERLETELVQRAAQRAESPGMFNERFFQDHRELALLSETARSVLGEPGPADLFVGAEGTRISTREPWPPEWKTCSAGSA